MPPYPNRFNHRYFLIAIFILFVIAMYINPKVWSGIKWLATYISIRPGELINLREEEIDIKLGHFIIPHPKENVQS